MNHKFKLKLFLTILRDYFKISLKYMFEWDQITYKGIKSFNICLC